MMKNNKQKKKSFNDIEMFSKFEILNLEQKTQKTPASKKNIKAKQKSSLSLGSIFRKRKNSHKIKKKRQAKNNQLIKSKEKPLTKSSFVNNKILNAINYLNTKDVKSELLNTVGIGNYYVTLEKKLQN